MVSIAVCNIMLFWTASKQQTTVILLTAKQHQWWRGTWISRLGEAWCQLVMMTSSNGNIFHVTDPLWGEFTVHEWIPLTKASDAELWCFLWSAPEQTADQTIETLVIWDAGDLSYRRAHYDITVMVTSWASQRVQEQVKPIYLRMGLKLKHKVFINAGLNTYRSKVEDGKCDPSVIKVHGRKEKCSRSFNWSIKTLWIWLVATRALFQYKDRFSRYGDSHVKDETILSLTWGSLYANPKIRRLFAFSDA